MIGFSEFRLLYNQLFPEAGDLSAYKLLQGSDNKSLQTDRAIWQLSRKVLADPAIAEMVRNTPADELAAKLPGVPGGASLMADVQELLAVYGRRSDTVQELADASWTEDPRVLFTTLKAYIDQPEDPENRRKAMEREREEAVAAARAALANHPEEVRGGFEALLAAAQSTSFLQEDHNYWIDQRGLHEVRQVCMELGRRLAANGQLAAADDIFMFTKPEAADLALSGADGKATAAQRRAEMERAATISAPPMVGTDYGPPPDNPITRSIARFFGGPPAQSEQNLLRGNAGSSGKLRGTARIVHALVDADRLEPGEILVTPTTSPPWTPLFGIAAAVVTETGGALSHCAIVSREYGIPCVVGVAGATAMIRDGQEIEVDGDAGTVRLL
jgi:rifampicin phosphotransferase